MAAFLALHGFTLLLLEALRADFLVIPGGIRAAQVVGLLLVLAAIWWMRREARSGAMHSMRVNVQ